MSNTTLSQRRIKRLILYPLQALLVYALYGIFKLLPLDAASATGGFIGRQLGALMSASKKARRNLQLAMPELTESQRERILIGMWDNLGRIMAEYPHLDEMEGARVEVIGADILQNLHNAQRPFIMLSGHFANWEILPVTAAKRGLPLQGVYRHANNPYVDRLLKKARTPAGDRLARKGYQGARSVHGMLRTNGAVGMLIDQKYNGGMAVPFFGRPAMTAPAAAILALQYDAPIIPVICRRLRGAHFRLTVLPELEKPQGLDKDAAVLDIMTRLNALIESWVREEPAQWLWLHRRWND